MKLTIIKLDSITRQDEIDLAKIWPHLPTDWPSWLSDTRMIFAARFNDRLLGAVKVLVSDKGAELIDLCIREVTRRRGVGLYLLEDLQAQLPEVSLFFIQAQPENAVFDAFMLACGFDAVEGRWQKNRLR